jgi:hypothetical protein
MLPLIPLYKPHMKLDLLGPDDEHPSQLPFMSDNRVYVYSSTGDSDFMKDPVKRRAWMSNKIKGPDKWWLASIEVGWHPNIKELQKLCNNEAPASVVSLYHPLWQFRFALGVFDQLLIDNARFDWEFFWAQKKGLGIKMNSTAQ